MPKPSPTPTQRTKPEWLVQFGRRLLVARGQAGLTQQSLGAPDLSKSFISLLETGRSYPSVETVVSLARRVRGSVASLLIEEPELKRETAFNLLHLADKMDPASQGTRAARLIATAETLLPDMPADLAAQAALVRARAAMLMHKLDEATRLADEAASIAAHHHLGSAGAKALAFKGMIEVRRGAYTRAIPILERAIEQMRRTRIARTEESIWALLSLGSAGYYLGQGNRAQRAYKRAQELATRLHNERLRGRALMGLGLVEWTRKRLDPAVELLSKAYDSFEQVEDLIEMSRALTNLGLVRKEQGLHAEALAVLERALRMKGKLGDTRGRSVTLDEMAQVLLEMNRRGDAARAARQAMKAASVVSDVSRKANAQVTLARVMRAQGRRREAIALLKTAVATLRRLGSTDLAAKTADELGLMLKDTGARTRGAEHVKRASRPKAATSPIRSPEHAIEGLPLS